MSFWQVLFLAIIQGITEFLPISSSGHLALFQNIFHLKSVIIFDIFVHVGTLLSILFFFRKELIKTIKGFFKKDRDSWHFFSLLVIGSLPVAIVGFFLNEYIEIIFASMKLVGFSFLITSFFLLSTKFLKERKFFFKNVKWLDSFVVGLFQAIAILPGVSRSGATITSGLLKGFKREMAFEFSFFLAIPAIIGALILQIPDLQFKEFNFLWQSLLGMAIAVIVGYFSLKILKKILVNSYLWLFGFYCLFLGLILIIF